MGENKNAFSDRILKIKLCGFETQWYQRNVINILNNSDIEFLNYKNLYRDNTIIAKCYLKIQTL
jgi:hypothetical protein